MICKSLRAQHARARAGHAIAAHLSQSLGSKEVQLGQTAFKLPSFGLVLVL
uniref:Uncharacterized protein n=2 Tax=Aegilops tauschii subsp. strangulata TaxID=200361 RepID=A0A453NCY5_AEGTS